MTFVLFMLLICDISYMLIKLVHKVHLSCQKIEDILILTRYESKKWEMSEDSGECNGLIKI